MGEKHFDKMNDKEKIIRLIIKEVSGEADERESRQLHELMESDSAIRDEYTKYQNLWKQLKTPQPPEVPDWEKNWAQLEEKLDASQSTLPVGSPTAEGRTSGKPLYYWLAAAVLIVVVGVSLGILLRQNKSEYLYLTRNAEKKEAQLPDGSRVILNHATQLQYTLDQSEGRRLVYLEGEAFFSVIHDSLPFVVTTENASVRVLGTQFNVKARRRITRVVVKEGTVEFRQKSAKKRSVGVVLTANQASMCKADEPPATPKPVAAESLLGWLKHKITFQQTPLPEICQELERTFDIRIELSKDLQKKSLTLTGTFEESEAPRDILKAICLALDLQLKMKNGKFFISSR